MGVVMHPCSVCGMPDEEHPEGMCCQGCTCSEDPAVGEYRAPGEEAPVRATLSCDHDFYYGECQECGETHPENCLGCNVIHVEPSHSYEAPILVDDTALTDDMRAEQEVRY